jgi:hypothetical protein
LLDESFELDVDDDELSVLDELVEPVEVDEVEADVAPQRISDAMPVMPMLRMLTVAVRFVASFLPFVLMSTTWPHPVLDLLSPYVPARFFEAP